MANQRKGGIIQLRVGGEIQQAKGDFTYGFGAPKREAIVGSDGIHGYKETPQVPFIEGEITDRDTLDVAKLLNMTDVTVSLDLANGKVFFLRNAWHAGDGQVSTGEGNLAIRFEGLTGEEVS